MQFLYPNMLWGLLALTIPVIVHLFNFRKTKKVYFSNVALLKTVDTKTSSFRKLKNILVMLARMLFIASLVLAFAQPVIPSKDNLGKIRGLNGIYLDNSQSMQNTFAGKKMLDLGVIKVDELLTLFNKTSNLQFSTNDFDGTDQFVTSATKVKDRLTTVNFSETSRELAQVYQRQKNIAEKYNPAASNHLFWFSDFQKSTAGKLEDLKVDSSDVLHLIPIEGNLTQNVFVDSVWLNVPFVREMQNNVITVRVFNSGTKAVEKLPLKLYIDEVQTSTSSVDIAANSSGTAQFNFTVSKRGVHKGKIAFDDQPITFDNEYYFVLEASPSIRILHLFGNRSEQNYVSKIFTNDSLYQFKSFSVDNFNPGEIQNSDLVVLEGVNTIEGEKRSVLNEFVRNGGNLTVIPSVNFNPASYQTFLGTFGIQNIQSLQTNPTAWVEMDKPNASSPFFEDVFEKGTQNTMISLPRAISKMDWSGVGEKVLTLRNGKSYLTRTKVGSGNIYLLASPLNKEFGNFAEHALFVPTFFKMAYLSAKADRLAYNFNEGTIEFNLPNAPKNAVYKLKNNGFELIPVQSLRGKSLMLTLPKSSELTEKQSLSSGIFQLEINGKTEKYLALNHCSSESIMNNYTAEELRTHFAESKNIRVYDNVQDGDFIEAFRDTSLDKPYWKYFIIAALLFLVIEILVTRLLKNT